MTLAKPLKAGETLELPTKKELAKSQFETNGGRDVAESKPSSSTSVKDAGDLTGGLERPNSGGVSVEGAGTRSLPPSIEIESLDATHDAKNTRFDEKWTILRPSDFASDMDFPNPKFPDNPAVFEVLSKDGKPPYPFRIKLKTPLKGETLKSDQLLRATLQIETARDAGVNTFTRISSQPDGGVRIDNPRFDAKNPAFAALGENAGARSLTLAPSGATELVQPYGDALEDAPQTLPTTVFSKMPLKEEFRLAGAENAASVAEALCIWAKGGSSKVGGDFEFEIEPLNDAGRSDDGIADFEIEALDGRTDGAGVSDFEIEPLPPKSPESTNVSESKEEPPLIANEERLDAEDVPTETPSLSDTNGGDEVRTETVTPPGPTGGGTTTATTAKADNASVAPENPVSETVVTPKPTGSNTEVTTDDGQSVSTTPNGQALRPDSSDTTAPSSEVKAGDSASTTPSSIPSVTPSNPTVTAGSTSDNATTTNVTPGVSASNTASSTVDTSSEPRSSDQLAGIASKLSSSDPLKADLAAAKKRLDSEVATNRTAEGDKHFTDAFKKIDPSGKVVFEKNKVTSESSSESTTELADGTTVSTSSTSKNSVSKNELTSDQAKTSTTTGTDGSTTTVKTGHGVKLTDKSAAVSSSEVVTENASDGSSVTSGGSSNVKVEKDKLSVGGTSTHATTDVEGNKTSHDTATNLTTDGSGENFNISHSDKRSETNADGSGNTRNTSGSVTMKDGSMSSSVKHDRSDTTVSDDGTKTTDRMGGSLDIGPDSFKATGSGGRTVTDADGNSSSVDVNAAVTSESIAAGIKTSDVEKNEDGSSTTSSTTGNVKIDRKHMAGDIGRTVTNVDADGNKESTSGKVRFDTDGKIGMDVSKETSDADGNKEKHSASVDYDHDAKKVGVKTGHSETTVGEDGLKTSTNTDVNVGFDADDGRLDVGTTHGRVVDDGQTKTESTDKVGVGLTEDTVAVNVGRTDRQTEKDGTSDGLSTNVGVDLGPDKSSVSAGFKKDSTTVDSDADKHKVGTSGNVGIDFADDKTSIRADLGVETEDNASGKDGEKSTRKSKHKVGIDTGNRDVFVSTGGSSSKQDKVKKTSTGGNVGFSMRDGVTVEGTHEAHDANSGSDARVHGGSASRLMETHLFSETSKSVRQRRSTGALPPQPLMVSAVAFLVKNWT